MDLLEIPNLRQKSTAVLNRWFQRSVLGLELSNDPFLPQRHRFLFGLYTVASVIYRWVVVFSIAFFLAKVLEPYGLQVIGRILAISGLVGLVIQPLRATWKFVRTPGRLQKVKRMKALRAVGIFAAAVAAFCLIPLPHSIESPFEIRPANPRYIYAGTGGRIRQVMVQPGQLVQADQMLVQLENLQTEFEAVRLIGQVRAAEVRLDSLQQQSHLDSSISGQEAAQQRVLSTAEQLSAKAAEDFQRLQVRSPSAGVVFEPPYRDDKPPTDGRLNVWSGSPLDPPNRGAFVSPEDLLCIIGDPQKMEAVLVIDQRDIQLVQTGMEVALQLESRQLWPTSGTIFQISQMEMQYSPANLASQAGGGVDTKADAEGGLRPINTSYQARVMLPDDPGGLRVGYRGTAKIYTEWRSLGWRVWRWGVRTFNFEF
jgi:putative peptide zinc metalloprotease protein